MPNTITLIVQGGSTINNIPWTSGMNVQQALEAAYNSFVNPPNAPMVSYWIGYFGSGLGYMVNMMDGTNQSGNKYWMLYINNVLAPEGIDSTTVNDGDQIKFSYEAYSAGVHGNTPVAKILARRAG